MKYKLISWNVNGVRAVARKGFDRFLDEEKPDILALQEIKMTDAAREKAAFEFAGYLEYWNPAERAGYSGTATLVKNGKCKVQSYNAGLDGDMEGRVQTLEFEKFYFVNIYFPNSKHGLLRLDYKLEFNEKVLAHLKKIEKNKPVVVTGDFNVAHEEIDLARPKDNVKNAGFTPEERAWVSKLINADFVDTFRVAHPDKIQYSWWSYKTFARDRNIGWRIDYFFVSKKIADKVKEAFILDEVFGSDHAPVGIILDI